MPLEGRSEPRGPGLGRTHELRAPPPGPQGRRGAHGDRAAQGGTHRLPPGAQRPLQPACPPASPHRRASNKEATLERREKPPPFMEGPHSRSWPRPNASLAAASPGPGRWDFSNRMPREELEAQREEGPGPRLCPCARRVWEPLSSLGPHVPFSRPRPGRREGHAPGCSPPPRPMEPGGCKPFPPPGNLRRTRCPRGTSAGAGRSQPGCGPSSSPPCWTVPGATPGDVWVRWGGRVSRATPPPSLAARPLSARGGHLGPGSVEQPAQCCPLGHPRCLCSKPLPATRSGLAPLLTVPARGQPGTAPRGLHERERGSVPG